MIDEEWNLMFAPTDKAEIKIPACFSITDEQGIETEYRTLGAIKSNETRRCYILFTDDSEDENGNIQIFASAFTQEIGEESIAFEPIETDYEWGIIEEAIKKAQDAKEDGTYIQF